jgi:general secretion pathway protein E
MAALHAHSEYLGEILVKRGVVPADKMGPLVQTVREKGQPLVELLVTS